MEPQTYNSMFTLFTNTPKIEHPQIERSDFMVIVSNRDNCSLWVLVFIYLFIYLLSILYCK
jgi:hypothetical protein